MADPIPVDLSDPIRASLAGPLFAWVILLAITAGNWLLTEFGAWHPEWSGRLVGEVILISALLKARIVMRYFMEVRTAPIILGRILDGWTILVAASLTVERWVV